MARGNEPRPKVSVEQLRILLEAIEEDSSLYNAANSDMITFLNIDKWMRLASRLNDCPDGAEIPVQNWKHVFRYWSEHTKKKREIMKSKRVHRLRCTREEAKVLDDLEERLVAFMRREASREYVDVTYVGNFGGDQENNGDESTSSGGGIKFVVQLQNVFEGKPDEITCPWKPPRKRTIVMKDADDNTDDVAKKFKIVYDQNVDEGEPEPHIQGHQLVRLRDVSQDIQDHITTIQSRIPVINDLWKHRCGDN